MKFRLVTILSLFLVMLFAFADASGQAGKGKKYKKRKVSGKSFSTSRFQSGGNRGGIFRPYHYVGVGINALNYYGDLAPLNKVTSTDVSFTRPTVGIMYAYRNHPNSSLRVNLNWGRLQADDINSKDNNPDDAGYGRYLRNLSFRNDIIELTIGANFYLFPQNGGPSNRLPFNFFIFLGGGLFTHSPKALAPDIDYQTQTDLKDAGQWVDLRSLGTEGQNLKEEIGPNGEVYKAGKGEYKKIEFNIPIGLGADLRLVGNLNAHIEFGYRFIFTDYLDDVSTKYVNLDRFGDNQLARVMSDRSVETNGVLSGQDRTNDFTPISLPFGEETFFVNGQLRSNVDQLSIRGNPKSKDTYIVTQIRLTYIIPHKNKSKGKFR